jgi:uncharacterized protein with FMN-binding domain
MSKSSSNANSLGTLIKKFFLSAFVIVTFLAYVLQQHFVAATQGKPADSGIAPTTSTEGGAGTVNKGDVQAAAPTSADIDIAGVSDNDTTPDVDSVSVSAAIPPTDTPMPTATSDPNALYKDGTYTGSEADAYYGMVQVQAVIQNGKITDVTFLEYPDHRRTSVSINRQAIPWLQQEAIQAQSAQVDLISGATLTSEAFVQSLQAALNAAHN